MNIATHTKTMVFHGPTADAVQVDMERCAWAYERDGLLVRAELSLPGRDLDGSWSAIAVFVLRASVPHEAA